jgi:hypothetical protein
LFQGANALIVGLAASMLAWACGPTPTRPEEPARSLSLWPEHDLAAQLPPAGPGHPALGLVEAVRRGDCGEVIAQSEPLRSRLLELVGEVFHPEGGEAAGEALADGAEAPGAAPARAMREVLEEYVYAAPPLLAIGEHRFELSDWWLTAYASCLVEADRLADAADLYRDRIYEPFDTDAAWRAALLYGWLGQPAQSLALLERWPPGAMRPEGYELVLDTVREGRVPPRSIQPEVVSLDSTTD